MKLEEGYRYIFRVEKEIDLGEDSFFVLQGPDLKKYLLNSEEYADYRLKKGREIDCRVDKINCQGEVFLEPEHPLYAEGEVYPFVVDRLENRISKSGSEIGVLILKDTNHTEVLIPLDSLEDNSPEPGNLMDLRVERIRKGKLIVVDESPELKGEKEGSEDVHSFEIISLSLGVDGKEYYTIRGKDGEIHILPAEYYAHYGLEVNKIFNGSYIRYREDESITIEPESPFFSPGKSYTFKVLEVVEVSDSRKILVLLDIYQFKHTLEYNAEVLPGQKLQFRVERIRKGWPILKPM